jgi:myo-inositol-1-phosphate synthase
MFKDVGFRLDRTEQLNLGGMAGSCRMLERSSLESRRISKANSVTGQVGCNPPEGDVHVGPGEHAPWLSDCRRRHIPNDKSREMLEEFIAGNYGSN